MNSSNPELQLKNTESAIKSKLIKLLTQLRSFKFVTTLVLVFKKIVKIKQSMNSLLKLKSRNYYQSHIENVFKSIYTAIIANIQKFLGKGSGWIIDSAIDNTICISKYNPLAGSSYITLGAETFAGRNYHDFHDFCPFSRKFLPSKIVKRKIVKLFSSENKNFS